jgi:hypothetical protein
MGERLSGDGVPGRRRAQPGAALSGPADVHDGDALETVLAAAIRAGDLAPEAEHRAVAAFRAAHAGGAHRVRTRRRDDWRPAEQRRARRPVKMTLGVVFAILTLGGVAVAAIGSAGSSTDSADGGGPGTTHPSAVAPNRPGDAASSPSSGSTRPTDRPTTAQDTEAHCRAYEKVRGNGRALDSTAWQRLIAAAGGEEKVSAYCSEQLAGATAAPSASADAGRSGKGAANSANGTGSNTGASGNSTAKNSQANGGHGNGKDK